MRGAGISVLGSDACGINGVVDNSAAIGSEVDIVWQWWNMNMKRSSVEEETMATDIREEQLWCREMSASVGK